jgi:Endopolygalacturonase
MQVYDVTEYGAIGDGKSNDTSAIQKAVDACGANGGGRVLIPSGKVFCSASIRLRSNIDFHIEAGATIIASGKAEDYTPTQHRNSTTGSMSESFDNPHALIYAVGENNVSISGFGTIDGNAEAFMDIITRYHISGGIFPRPKLIMLGNCKKVTITHITLQNASTWVLHPAACEDVLIHGIRILCNLRMANSDGIDPDHCRNVRISDCYIECADDCIVIKNTRVLEEYGPTENIIITGCTLISTSCAIKIGTETVSDFRNIIVDSCIITNSNRGLGIQLRDEGNVENVRFTNISINTRRFYDRWWGKAEPIYVTTFDRNENTKSGKIKNIYFGNISCKGENGVYISGQEDNKLEEIVLDNVRVEIHKWTKWDSGIYDKRPGIGEGLEYRDNAGVYCANAKDISLRHIKVVWEKDILGSYGAALETENVDELEVEDFKGKAANISKQDIIKR